MKLPVPYIARYSQDQHLLHWRYLEGYKCLRLNTHNIFHQISTWKSKIWFDALVFVWQYCILFIVFGSALCLLRIPLSFHVCRRSLVWSKDWCCHMTAIVFTFPNSDWSAPQIWELVNVSFTSFKTSDKSFRKLFDTSALWSINHNSYNPNQLQKWFKIR